MHESALDNFPSTDPVELYEREIMQLKERVNRLNGENAMLKTRLAMRADQPNTETGQIKTELRALNVSINLQF